MAEGMNQVRLTLLYTPTVSCMKDNGGFITLIAPHFFSFYVKSQFLSNIFLKRKKKKTKRYFMCLTWWMMKSRICEWLCLELEFKEWKWTSESMTF
jgi:hypothetical protein